MIRIVNIPGSKLQDYYFKHLMETKVKIKMYKCDQDGSYNFRNTVYIYFFNADIASSKV